MRQINALVLIASLAVAAPVQAQAPKDEGVSAFFGAVLVITVPGQDWSAKRMLKADHTFRESGDDGDVGGTWEVKDGKLCTHKTDQLPVYCNLGPGHKVGDVWSDADPVTGNKVMFALKSQ
jgi:hypothetical protein